MKALSLLLWFSSHGLNRIQTLNELFWCTSVMFTGFRRAGFVRKMTQTNTVIARHNGTYMIIPMGEMEKYLTCKKQPISHAYGYQGLRGNWQCNGRTIYYIKLVRLRIDSQIAEGRVWFLIWLHADMVNNVFMLSLLPMTRWWIETMLTIFILVFDDINSTMYLLCIATLIINFY